MPFKFVKPTSIGRSYQAFSQEVYAAWPVMEFVTVTAASVKADKEGVILCDCTSNAITVNLPPVSHLHGTVYIIKKIDSSVNAVTIDGSGSETIDGATTQTLSSQWDVTMIVCDGTQWLVI